MKYISCILWVVENYWIVTKNKDVLKTSIFGSSWNFALGWKLTSKYQSKNWKLWYQVWRDSGQEVFCSLCHPDPNFYVEGNIPSLPCHTHWPNFPFLFLNSCFFLRCTAGDMQAEVVVTCLLFSIMLLSYDLEMEMFISIEHHREDHCLHNSILCRYKWWHLNIFSRSFQLLVHQVLILGVYVDYRILYCW